MSFADKVQQMADEAPAAGFVNVNFGKLTVEVNVIEWKETEKDGAKVREPVRTPFKENTALKKGQNIELTFDIDVKEYNPNLNFEFKRNVIMQKTSEDGKFKTDWSEIVEPSLIAVFGKDWAKVITDKKGIYVAAETPDSVKQAKEGKKNYGTIKFIAKYKNSAECKAARDEKYGGNKSEGSEDELGIPAAIVEQVKSLYNSMGKNAAVVRPMLTATAPFNQYDVDALAAEAGIDLSV